MRLLKGVLWLVMAFLALSFAQARQTQSPGQPGPQQNQSGQASQPGQNPQNPVGQPGQTPMGQNGNANTQTILGQNAIGQQGQNPVGQNAKPGTQPIPGQKPIGQQGQNPVGQNGKANMQTIPGQNPIGQQGQAANGKSGQPGQVNHNILAQPGQSTFGQPGQFIAATNGYAYGTPLHQLLEVRSSLGLTADQINRLNALNGQLAQQYQAQTTNLSALSPEERAAKLQSMQSSQEADFLRSAGTILNPEQALRIRQMSYQAQGPAAFNNADVRNRLKLTEVQARLLQDVQLRNVGFLEDFVMPGGSGQDAATRFELHQRKMSEQVNAILDPSQRQLWQEMIGDVFIFKPNLEAITSSGANQQR
jgi:hypothetical protein